jgi:hypothetical protein
VVVRQHLTPGEDVHPPTLLLKANFGRIEHASDVVPVRDADEPLVAVEHLLPAHFERQWENLRRTECDPGLVQIHRIRFGIRTRLVLVRRAVPAFRVKL